MPICLQKGLLEADLDGDGVAILPVFPRFDGGAVSLRRHEEPSTA
jgi:hypothetical protein